MIESNFSTVLTEKKFVEQLKKNFDVNVGISDVLFSNYSLTNYCDEKSKKMFGEKVCLLYTSDLNIYNVKLTMKVLAFQYEGFHEILKLNIRINSPDVRKEMEPCRNYLQRHRNLNMMFLTLISFCKFVESRRLIMDIVLLNRPGLEIRDVEDGGKGVKYTNSTLSLQFGITWRIEWSITDHAVNDVIEVYYKNFEHYEYIEKKLYQITHPQLDFHNKLKLWKSIIDDINTETERKLAEERNSRSSAEAEGVVMISDTEDECTESSKFSKRRRKDIDNMSSSDVYVIPD